MIDPKTLDIYDPIGGQIPYPGYGGDIALTAPAPGQERPAIGVAPDAYRAARGLGPPPPPEQPGIDTSGHYDQEYPETMAATNRQRADLAAATLAPNAFQSSADPWTDAGGPDVSLAGMAANERAHQMIEGRHANRIAEIERNAPDPLRDEYEARKATAAIEELSPAPRPLIGEAGAFTQDSTPQGTFRNNAPAERLGDLRQREAANIKTIIGGAVMRQLQEELQRIERGTSLDHEGKEAPLAQPMSDEQKEIARNNAFKIAWTALQNAAGGKDYGGFMRPTYDPNAIVIPGGPSGR